MEKDYSVNINQLLFKMSDIYNKAPLYFDNNLGEKLLGKIVLNKVEGIVFLNLNKNRCVNMGLFKRSLEMMYKYKLEDVSFYENALEHVCNIMEKADFNFAFLKGAYLITNLYSRGMRSSNDIDILVEETDVDRCQKLLIENGFKQGHLKNGKIECATRREIILSKMNYGETIPFYKELDNRYVCVDINFSLDYKPATNNSIIHGMLNNTICVAWRDTKLVTLNIIDFIIHLCMHLYKEATTLQWVISRRDLNLYKFSDLNIIFHESVSKEMYEHLVEKIKEYRVENECFYALLNATKIYSHLLDLEGYAELLKDIQPRCLGYLNQVIDSVNKKIYTHDLCFEDWFACENRAQYLLKITKSDEE